MTAPPTNVSRLAGAVEGKCCSGMPQIVYYHPGAGTEAYWTARQLGGMLGLGVAQDIVEAYRFICDNYNPGDEIVLIGFSRGAFTARSVAEMVCKLGFLNRVGVDQLPVIFSDYQNWGKWKGQAYMGTKHLAAFTLENFERVKRLEATTMGDSREQIARELDDQKKALFKRISEMKGDSEHNQAAEAYRNMLAIHEMSLLDENMDMPMKGSVRVVGVWDTVGSLGLPRTSWNWNTNRKEKEICFASLEVHPDIEYAFHAIALDEWRTAFSPTMWERRERTLTKLRQVWFPGGHSNVGGGWEDQQIATIALAWMADQLTSVGVEFNGYEMRRIFYSVNPSGWGLGKIHNPPFKTAAPDKAHQYVHKPYNKIRGASTGVPIRRPGMYEAEGERANTLLLNPNEFVHPCVRIRYLYGGKGLDNVKHWTCRALTENGYRLVCQEVPKHSVRDGHLDGALKKYRTVNSVLIPYFESSGAHGPDSMATEDGETVDVPTHVVRVCHLTGDQELPPSAKHWVWVRDLSNGEKHVLHEEQVGIWERLFIEINDKLLPWNKGNEGGADKISWFSSKTTQPSKPMPDPTTYPKHYGYHDIVTWPKT